MLGDMTCTLDYDLFPIYIQIPNINTTNPTYVSNVHPTLSPNVYINPHICWVT